MRHKSYLFILFLTMMLTLTGCSNETTTAEPTETTTEASSEIISTGTSTMPATLRFVDAHGEWFETDIVTDAEPHPYNWDHLTNDENGISYEGDENYYIRHGIDVSKWQGNIDWEKVKAAGFDFAILRLGYRGYSEAGGMEIDAKFYQNIQGAQAAGLDVGVYFFSQAINEEEALEEANFVLNALDGYTLQLPVVYDPELIRDQEARTDNVTGEQFTKNTIIFCEAMNEAGYEPMIYSNMIWEAFLFDMTQLQDYPFWYADYEAVPQTPYDFVMWQYSESGTVDGINTPVDLNIMFVPVEN